MPPAVPLISTQPVMSTDRVQGADSFKVVKVLKFGGTSVGSADALERLVGILSAEAISSRPLLVVSALSGVTDWLHALEEETQAKRQQVWIRKLVRRHQTLSAEVLDHERHGRYLIRLAECIDELRDTVRQPPGPMRSHAIWASGEWMSAPLVALLLERHGVSSEWVDARRLIHVVESASGSWVVDRNKTRAQTESWYRRLPLGRVPVITGFLGAEDKGRVVTLGRGGSDYSASLIAEAVGASKFDRWTDVDGLYTADPRKDQQAGRFLYLLLEDATTWNEANQLGMHAHAFEPVLHACIPVHVRSTRNPQGDGTLILPARLPKRVEKDARELMSRTRAAT